MRAQRVLEDLDYDDLSEVSISLVQADEMAKLNWEYRKKEGATNVLSFAQETKESHVLGDVVICTDRAEEDAKKLGYTNMEMVEYLLIHGIFTLQASIMTIRRKRKKWPPELMKFSTNSILKFRDL
jgi:probable rRNA maturation factor